MNSAVTATAQPPSDAAALLPAEIDIARQVRAAVLRIGGVYELSAGQAGEIATYGPGETIGGVMVRRTAAGLILAVHIVAVYRPNLVLPVLAGRIRDTVQALMAQRLHAPVQAIDVGVDDLWFKEGTRR